MGLALIATMVQNVSQKKSSFPETFFRLLAGIEWLTLFLYVCPI